MTIENLYFYKFQASDYLEFSKRIFPILDQLDIETLGLCKPINTAKKAFATIESHSVAKIITPCNLALVKADGIRSDAIAGIKNYLMACQKRITPEWKVNARLLIEAIKKYDWWFELEPDVYKNKSIRSLLKDINELPQLKEAVKTLQVQDWLDELEAAQSHYEAVLRTSVEDIPIKDSCVCTDLRNSFELLFKYIDVMQRIQPNEIFSHIIKDINNIISEFNSLVRSRKTNLEQQNKTMA